MRIILASLILLGGLAGVARAAPAGMASQVSGKAEVRAGPGGVWKPLRFMQQLEAGDTVRCGPGGEAVVVVFANGGRYRIGPGATGVVEAGQVKGGQRASALPGRAIQIARAMTGSRADAFLARPAQSHQRLTPQFPGWMLEGEHHFSWAQITGASTYSFSLFDANDNVVWSTRVSTPNCVYPAELPPLSLRRPFVWRLSAFSQSGKPLPESRWGMVTFLNQQDADQLTEDARALEQMAAAEHGDATALVLQAELYRSYGVMEKALEILETPQLVNQPGIQEAQNAIYRQAGRYAQHLHAGAPTQGAEVRGGS